jgi:hypothetical protein
MDIVTGKRRWPHGIEYGENDVGNSVVMYRFRLVRKSGGQVEFVPRLINSFFATGCRIQAIDVRGDGRPEF